MAGLVLRLFLVRVFVCLFLVRLRLVRFFLVHAPARARARSRSRARSGARAAAPHTAGPRAATSRAKTTKSPPRLRHGTANDRQKKRAQERAQVENAERRTALLGHVQVRHGGRAARLHRQRARAR